MPALLKCESKLIVKSSINPKNLKVSMKLFCLEIQENKNEFYSYEIPFKLIMLSIAVFNNKFEVAE